MHLRISQISKKYWYKQLIIKQGINKHSILGNTVKEHKVLFKDGQGIEIAVNRTEETFTK